MPWITEDGQWTNLTQALTTLVWTFDGDAVKLTTTNPTSNFSYVTHTPAVMKVLAGQVKSKIMIKNCSESPPRPGCFATDIWDWFQYRSARGNFSQVKGYWRSPQPRGRRRMRHLSEGHR